MAWLRPNTQLRRKGAGSHLSNTTLKKWTKGEALMGEVEDSPERKAES